jgi:hypothetical protein
MRLKQTASKPRWQEEKAERHRLYVLSDQAAVSLTPPVHVASALITMKQDATVRPRPGVLQLSEASVLIPRPNRVSDKAVK